MKWNLPLLVLPSVSSGCACVRPPLVLRSCRVPLPLLNLPLKLWIELDATRMQDGSRRDPAAPYRVRRAPAVRSRSQSSCSHHYGAWYCSSSTSNSSLSVLACNPSVVPRLTPSAAGYAAAVLPALREPDCWIVKAVERDEKEVSDGVLNLITTRTKQWILLFITGTCLNDLTLLPQGIYKIVRAL